MPRTLSLPLSLTLTLALASMGCTVARGNMGDAGFPYDTNRPQSPDVQFPDSAVDAACYGPIDVVFVLDVSTSMTGEFTRLRAGIGSIFAATDQLTTDHTFGLVVFVDDALVVNGCTSFATAADLQTEFDRWRNFCSTNGDPASSNSNYDCPENSLDALYAAATMCTWRPDATHVLIHVTDDTFMERPAIFSMDTFQAGVPAQHTYAEVSDALVAAQIRVGAFAQLVAMDCGAGTSPDTAQGFLAPYQGMPSLPDATHGQAWDIAEVRAGHLDMATAINSLVASSYCRPF